MADPCLNQVITRSPSQITCVAPATAGELIQGKIDENDYLVNFPIDLFSAVQVSLTTAFKGVRASHPTHYTKAVAAVSQLLALVDNRCGLELRFLSHVPRSKGLASSTSEIAAALEAAASLLGYKLTEEMSCLINGRVEATDCVQATGISLVHQLKGEVLWSFPTPTGISVILVDCGGSISTDEFDREKFHYVAKQNQADHREALQKLICGLTKNCSRMIGRAATISASINQKVIYKEQFPALLALSQMKGGLGVNCAHSGTVLGLMYDPLQVSGHKLLEKMRRIFGKENVFPPHNLICGGVHATSH